METLGSRGSEDLDSDSCTGTTGAVLRCSNGSCLAASARWLGSVGSALLAEAEALRDGLRLIPAGSYEHIILETDAQDLVLLWQARAKQRSEVATILDDIETIATAFTSFRVRQTRRPSNFAAHLCAQHASATLESFSWLSLPSFLQRCLQSDCNETF